MQGGLRSLYQLYSAYLTKAKIISDDWPEIREKLVCMGTDIYNRINGSDI